MSLFYKAVAGQLRTVYDLFSFVSFRRPDDMDDMDEQFATINTNGKPVSTTTTMNNSTIHEQKIYNLRPRKQVNYLS